MSEKYRWNENYSKFIGILVKTIYKKKDKISNNTYFKVIL